VFFLLGVRFTHSDVLPENLASSCDMSGSPMLSAIRNFFEQHLAAKPGEPQASAERRAQIAAAVLLVEVARSDHDFSEAERQAVFASVQGRFGLSAAEAHELLALAEAQSRDAHDIYQFTSKIDAGFSLDQKVQLLEELWRAAYADSVLHAHEEYLIRRVADMLHLSHSQFIAAKLRALPGPKPGECRIGRGGVSFSSTCRRVEAADSELERLHQGSLPIALRLDNAYESGVA